MTQPAIACAVDGCGGTVLADGYCDTCGTKAAVTAAPAAGATSLGAIAGGVAASPGVGAVAAAGSACAQDGCGGTILADGYCDTCGTKAAASPPARTAVAGATGSVPVDASLRSAGFTSGSAAAGGSRRTRRGSTRTTSSRRRIGRGLVEVPTAPPVDPASVVMETPEVAEHKRFCGNCGEPVGRKRGERPGRSSGFCASCRTPFDFVPKLAAGDLVGGQYEVVGCLAHGGLGWIYLARDTAVSDRWVVLKGLLNAGDDAAMAAAVAERRFLAEVQHPNIVEIYNFVTHDGAGYTVMEYVGGKSLKQVLKSRRKAAGRTDPLPVEQAIAYLLAVIPAFTYLHERGLVYCDFKPDNLIQVGDDVKLIDLGGVRRIDDPDADIYGTIGFQAPEVPTIGTSVASDLYTIGRTLAVLILDWPTYTSAHRDTLPDPLEHPALRDNEPLLRLLRKACAPHPDDRFQTAEELGEQLLGVLRILVAARTGEPRPGPSAHFAGAPIGDALPVLAVEPGDPAAGFLTALPNDDPAEALRQLHDGLDQQQVELTLEARLRRARLLVDTGDPDAALHDVDAVLAEDPWEWRAAWVRGLAGLAASDLAGAAAAFDRCRSEAPGELAPLYAAAVVAERQGDHARAAALYDLVVTVDRYWIGAAEGLARMRVALDDVDGAVAALDRVPPNHRAHAEAQLLATRTLVDGGRIDEASRRAARLDLKGRDALQLEAALLDRALAGLQAGTLAEDDSTTVAGATLTRRGVARGLEQTYRALARVTPERDERIRLVDIANSVRPRTLL